MCDNLIYCNRYPDVLSFTPQIKFKMPLLEEVKSLIKSILISNPNPSTVSKLDREYLKQIGTKIPYLSLGYATLKEFLHSIPDVLAISVSGGKTRLSAIMPTQTAHNIHNVVSMQRQENELDSNKTNLRGSRDLYDDWPKNNNEWSKESYLSYYTNISTEKSTKLPSINGLEQCSKLNQHAKELSSKSLEIRKVATNGANQNAKTGCVPAAVQNNLKIIIKNFKNGLVYTQLPVAYKFWFDKELDFREFNYNNLLEMCQALQNIFLLTYYREEITLFDQSESLPKDTRKHLKLFKSFGKKKSSSMSQLSSDLNQSKCLRKSEPLSQSTVMTMSQQSTSLCSKPVSSKQLVYSTKPVNCSSQTSDNEQIEYPTNVIKFSEEISSEFITITDQIHQTVSVNVTEVYDPSKFWITLHKNYRRSEDLHQKMQYWSNFRKNFKIPEKCLRVGLYCAALYNNEYYRGKVVKLSLSRHVVKVYFIDFGTVAITDSDELLFLHKDFIKLPQQAIRARLAGIQPADADSPWSEDAFKYFVSQISEKTLEAHVFKINKESQIVELILQNNNMSNYINDNLVKAGHAVFDYEKQNERPFAKIVPIVNFIHLYPTFDEIEKGIVPTAKDTFKLRRSGRGYDYIYPKYFKNDDLNVSINVKETGQRSNKQDESLLSCKSLSDPAKCRLRLAKIISSENQLHSKKIINIPSTNFLELQTNITGSCSVDILSDFSLLENFQIKQKLQSFILQNLHRGNTASLFYIKRLLHELQPLTYFIQNVYCIVKDEYMSLPPHILQFFITMLLNCFDSGKLLELYTFVYHVSSPSTIHQSPIDGTNCNEIITSTDFSGCPIYLYHIHNQVYVDMREMLQLTNLNELPLYRITNETDMENFVGSLLIITLIEYPKLIREIERYKINFGDKLFLLEVQFIPQFYEIFANVVLPQSSFEDFLKKINRIP